jgi:hypothetical protein
MSKVKIYRYQYTDPKLGQPSTAKRMGTEEYINQVGGWAVEGSGIEVDASKVDVDGKTEIGLTFADETRKAWKCEICGQVVGWRANGKPLHPVQVYENCKLKDHYVGDECVAYRDLSKAENWSKGHALADLGFS